MRETYFWELWTTMYRVFLFSCVIFTLVKDEFCQDKTSVRGLGFALHIMYVDFNNKSSYNIMTIFCFCFFILMKSVSPLYLYKFRYFYHKVNDPYTTNYCHILLYYIGSPRQNVLKSDVKKSRICPISGQSNTI